MKKRLAALTMALCAAAGMTAWASEWAEVADSDPEITIVCGHGAAEATGTHTVLLEVAELLAEKSNGKITLDIYPNCQLGSEPELMTSTAAGDIQMVVSAPIVANMPELAVFDLPMAVSDIEVAREACAAGEFRDAMEEISHNYNYELAGMVPVDFRVLTTNTEITDISSFEGMDIRTMENEYHMTFWSNLGCNPTPLSFSDVYVSLQQGLIDAQENPCGAIFGGKFTEQQDYLVETNHIPYMLMAFFNEDWYNELPDNYRQIIDKAMDECFTPRAGIVNDETKEEYYKEFTEVNGTEIVEPSQELLDAMREAAAPVWEMVREAVGDDLVDAYLSACGVVLE